MLVRDLTNIVLAVHPTDEYKMRGKKLQHNIKIWKL